MQHGSVVNPWSHHHTTADSLVAGAGERERS